MSKTSTDLVAAPSRRLAWSGPTMGARWSAVAYVPAGFDPAWLQERLQDAVDEVDRQMSSWRPDSDVNRLNAAPVGAWVSVPPQLCAVLETALAVGQASDGTFDVGVGDLVMAWGFGGGRRTPDPALIRATAGRPSFQPPKSLLVDAAGRRVRKLAPLTLDLSGIAKGFGVDELGRVLGEAGLSSWLVGIDGEMRAAGRKPDGRPWAVGHEAPIRGWRGLAGVLELDDAAVATSGTYRHEAVLDGETVTHTMDPRTGAPLAGDLASVTVVARTCMAADAWATAILVAGARHGAALARKAGLGVVLTRRDGGVASTL
jgi:FAD:protein FMN transferase